MKNILIILAIIISTSAIAGNEKAYNKAMSNNIKQLNEAKAPEQFHAVANKFIRIGDAEKDKWLPYYYASLSYVWKSLRIKEVESKDQNLLESIKYLEKAKSLEDNNAEISALEGFIYMIQISVDPGARGQSHTPKTFAAFGKALGIKPSNPRALLFKGQMQYGMSQFFGSGTEEACAMIVKSIALFDEDDKKESLLPTWGLSSAKRYIEKCNTPAKSSD